MRVKTGFARRRAHRIINTRTKGFRMTKRRLIRVAKDTLSHAGSYAFRGRKQKKSENRSLWITRINGALAKSGLNYSKFIKGLKDKKIELDRRVIAEIIQDDPSFFQKIVEEVKN